MSQFLKAQDFLPIMAKQSSNIYWNTIIQIVTDYDHLLQRQKNQIAQTLQQTQNKRIDLVQKYNGYKDSLKYDGVAVKKDIIFVKNQKLYQFFVSNNNSFHQVIRQIVCKLFAKQSSLAKLIKSYPGARKFQFADFCQNLAFLIFPPYIPQFNNQKHPHLMFFVEIMKNWDYNLQLCRPDHYTPIDEVIQGYLKTPEIFSYMERISTKFLQKIHQHKLDVFAFDQDAVKNEFQVRKLTATSYNPPKQKQSLLSRVKFWRKKTKDDNFQQIESMTLQKNMSQTKEQNQIERKQIHQIMRKRQSPLISIITFTVQQILKQEPPQILCQMLKIFNIILINKMKEINKKTKKQFNQKEFSISKMQKHYCYFLMTNFLLSQLHSKFTVSYQGTSQTMNHADLQNISQIWRIISSIFQGSLPTAQKYKHLINSLKDYKSDVQRYYQKMLQRATISELNCFQFQKGSNSYEYNNQIRQKQQKINQNSHNKEQILQQLLNRFYQGTFIVSFNDLRIILDMIRFSYGFCDSLRSSFISNASSQSSSSQIKQRDFSQQDYKITQQMIDVEFQFDLSKEAAQLSFLQDQTAKTLFHSKGHARFKNVKYDPCQLLFVIRNQSPSKNDITFAYTGQESPLKHLPLITNMFLHQTNLSVNQVLEVTQSLQVIKNLPINQLKYYLNKLSIRYHKLFIHDSCKIQKAFKDSLLQSLRSNLKRKSIVLSSKDNFCKKIDYFSKLIQYYKHQLKSLQFYDKISQTFIKNIKIKVYVNIENNLLKLRTNLNDLKGFKVGSLMSSELDSKTDKKNNDDFILRNSFKSCQSVMEFLNLITKTPITYAALIKGRKVDEFNAFFIKFCEILVSEVSGFINKSKILQNLDQQKFAKVVVRKIQDYIFQKICVIKTQKNEKILQQDDNKFKTAKLKINIQSFYQKDLKQFNLQRQFLLSQGQKKFKAIIQSKSIQQKITFFQQLFVLIFTIVGFSMAKNKISAQIINPIMQYILVQCQPQPYHQTLYVIQSLKWRETPETNYNLALFQSSLAYIQKTMPIDYPL